MILCQLFTLKRSSNTEDFVNIDELVPLRNTNAAIIPLEIDTQQKLNKRGVLRPVYCILPSPEESDEGPAVYYPERYSRRRTIQPPTEKIRTESQDRFRWRERGTSKRTPLKYDIRKSFSSDQLYQNHPVSLDNRVNLTSTSSISSGSDYSSSNGSQSRSMRWQGSGIPVLRPRGYWGSHPDKLRFTHESPSSLRSLQRQSSGSESSGYFTPPPADRPSAVASPVVQPIERPESILKTTIPSEFRITSAENGDHKEKQPSQEEYRTEEEEEEEDAVEYIEVINSVPAEISEESSKHEEEQHQTQNNLMEDVNSNYENHVTENGFDEVDRKSPFPNVRSFDLETTRPIAENRKWSKSEVDLKRSLPLIETRKNINSAPIIKDVFNNNMVSEDFEENAIGSGTHICNNTNINITIPLPGVPMRDEEKSPEPPLVRRLSKRYSQVPVLKKPPIKPVKVEGSAKTTKVKTDVVHDVLDQMASQEWEVVMTGLRNLGKLAKSRSEVIEPQMHATCLALSSQIRNLRSQVARAACQASQEMFLSCSQRGLETELEGIVGPLLHRTADTNKFLREDANNALNTMAEKIQPAKVVSVLTTKGTTHQNAIVRGTAVRILEELVRSHGTEKIFALGKEVRDKVVLAGANALTEGSLDTRKHGKALLRHMISHPNFRKTLLEAVPPHTIRHIAKTLNSL